MTTASKVRKIIGTILLVMCGITAAVTLSTGENINGMLTFVIVYGIVAVVLLVWPTSNNSKLKNTNSLNPKVSSSAVEIKKLTGSHFSGLPIAEKVFCDILFMKNKLSITGSGVTYELPYSRIINMQTLSDVDIQKQYVSSVGGAIGGAALFGPLGAMIGGRTKEKIKRTASFYFVVTYDKDGKVQYLNFQIYTPFQFESCIKKVKPYFKQSQSKVSL